MHNRLEDDLNESFPLGNDSLASYWIHDATVSCQTAWVHCWSEKTSKKIIKAIENLKKIEIELIEEENHETKSHAAADR